jgi:hypothetical protein
LLNLEITDDAIDKMEAGPAIDALIAEHVMGFEVVGEWWAWRPDGDWGLCAESDHAVRRPSSYAVACAIPSTRNLTVK